LKNRNNKGSHRNSYLKINDSKRIRDNKMRKRLFPILLQNLKKIKKFHERTYKAKAPRVRIIKRKMMTMKRQKELNENIWKRWRELNEKKQRELLLQRPIYICKDKRMKWKLGQEN